jgi:hypothetical protein
LAESTSNVLRIASVCALGLAVFALWLVTASRAASWRAPSACASNPRAEASPGRRRAIRRAATLPAEELVRQTEKAILDWAGVPIRDDVCLLAMKPVP